MFPWPVSPISIDNHLAEPFSRSVCARSDEQNRTFWTRGSTANCIQLTKAIKAKTLHDIGCFLPYCHSNSSTYIRIYMHAYCMYAYSSQPVPIENTTVSTLLDHICTYVRMYVRTYVRTQHTPTDMPVSRLVSCQPYTVKLNTMLPLKVQQNHMLHTLVHSTRRALAPSLVRGHTSTFL